MGESWIGIDVSYILIAMIFGVGVMSGVYRKRSASWNTK